MSCLGSVMVDLSDKLENPGESYSFAGHIDAASYSVGDKDLALPHGASFDVVFTNAGDGILVTGMVRAEVTGACDRCLEPASFEVAGEIEEYYLFEEPEDPDSMKMALSSSDPIESSILAMPSLMPWSWIRRSSSCAARIAEGCVPRAVQT